MIFDNLRILRELNNYTQEHIAEHVLGISQNTYSRLERNPERITAEQAKKLANLYKVTIEDLLSEAKPTVSFGSCAHESTITNKTEVQILKEEVNYLRRQNLELLKVLKEKHTEVKNNAGYNPANT